MLPLWTRCCCFLQGVEPDARPDAPLTGPPTSLINATSINIVPTSVLPGPRPPLQATSSGPVPLQSSSAPAPLWDRQGGEDLETRGGAVHVHTGDVASPNLAEITGTIPGQHAHADGSPTSSQAEGPTVSRAQLDEETFVSFTMSTMVMVQLMRMLVSPDHEVSGLVARGLSREVGGKESSNVLGTRRSATRRPPSRGFKMGTYTCVRPQQPTATALVAAACTSAKGIPFLPILSYASPLPPCS